MAAHKLFLLLLTSLCHTVNSQAQKRETWKSRLRWQGRESQAWVANKEGQISERQHISIDEVGNSDMQVDKSNIFRKIVIGAISLQRVRSPRMFRSRDMKESSLLYLHFECRKLETTLRKISLR